MLTQHIREFLQVTPGPFPNFFQVEPGDKAKSSLQDLPIFWVPCTEEIVILLSV